MDKTIEQQALELLAIEAENSGWPKWAATLRSGNDDDTLDNIALRAIARALTRPAPSDEEVEAAAEAIWRVAENPHKKSAWKKFSRLWPVAADHYRRMARAALGPK